MGGAASGRCLEPDRRGFARSQGVQPGGARCGPRTGTGTGCGVRSAAGGVRWCCHVRNDADHGGGGWPRAARGRRRGAQRRLRLPAELAAHPDGRGAAGARAAALVNGGARQARGPRAGGQGGRSARDDHRGAGPIGRARPPPCGAPPCGPPPCGPPPCGPPPCGGGVGCQGSAALAAGSRRPLGGAPQP